MQILRVILVAVALGTPAWVMADQLAPPLESTPTPEVETAIGSGHLEQAANANLARIYVEYTYYKKKNGIVTKLSSGRVGPYPTRSVAQSVADSYNANDITSGGVRYYYSARVR